MKCKRPPRHEQEKRGAASKRKAFSGLCSTCKDAPVCTFPGIPQTPVWQCEEFAGYENPSGKSAPIDPENASGFSPHREERNSDRHKGLCVICDGRETCMFPKPPGGVWHCEEYS